MPIAYAMKITSPLTNPFVTEWMNTETNIGPEHPTLANPKTIPKMYNPRSPFVFDGSTFTNKMGNGTSSNNVAPMIIITIATRRSSSGIICLRIEPRIEARTPMVEKTVTSPSVQAIPP
jgi:hypothetical protein